MISGIGHDLTELSRVKTIALGRLGMRFVERILTVEEQAEAQRRFAQGQARWLEFIGGRFAAKEAVAKAVGTGIGRMVSFQDIELLPDAQGKPVCQLSKAAYERLGWREETTAIHVSITHTEQHASAFVVIERLDFK